MALFGLFHYVGLAFVLLGLFFNRRTAFKSKLVLEDTIEITKIDHSINVERDIVHAIKEGNKNCVVFYGSETGTAEDFAIRLAREVKSRFGLESMIADLEEYDYHNLHMVSRDTLYIFILATYGDGEPTENAVAFHDFITHEEPPFEKGTESSLENLSYATFGLGNSTYEKFNHMVRIVDKALHEFGAQRLGDPGEGDDGKGTLEEDFLAWKDTVWASILQKFGLQERATVYEPGLLVSIRDESSDPSDKIHVGELGEAGPAGNTQGPFSSTNPYFAPVAESRELFKSQERNCLHLEIDLANSGLSYSTGDHVGVWSSNSSDEVDSLLRILGWSEKKHQIVDNEARHQLAKIQVPSPTTLDTLFRYHLDICAPVSRELVLTFANFAPDENSKQEMAKLGSDKQYFSTEVRHSLYNLADLLSHVSKGQVWRELPLPAVIEGLRKLQPRYYSISSSSLAQPGKVSITAVVESKVIRARGKMFKGVTTNYLLALSNARSNPSLSRNSPRGTICIACHTDIPTSGSLFTSVNLAFDFPSTHVFQSSWLARVLGLLRFAVLYTSVQSKQNRDIRWDA